MTHAFLQSELTSLVSDSKRKHNDVRTAADQSLSDLKSISVTSETQVAADLYRRPRFIEPFLLACSSKHAKLTTCAVTCLQRLTASKAVPRDRLPDVLQALQDGVSAGYEAQLKILQTLPSLLQLYSDDIYGALLARVLELCIVLQVSKTAVVSNTAAATFQQLITSVFDKAEKTTNAQKEDGRHAKASIDQGQDGDLADDAVPLFEDFCLLLDQQGPLHLKVSEPSTTFLLETLQGIVTSYDFVLETEKHSDLQWSGHLVQGLSRVVSKKDNFGDIARALSILLLLFQSHAEHLHDMLLDIVPLILSALEKDASPPWRRTLVMEFFRGLCSEFRVVRDLFGLFDRGKESPRLIGQLMSSLVRIASEDPSLIGLGRQSTVPIRSQIDPSSDEAASIEAQGLAGAITSMTSGDSSAVGISTLWSLVPTPLIEQPDKISPPSIPSTYIYTLVLGCISALCDGLSKFVMPLSVPGRAVQREESESGRRNSSATDRTERNPSRKGRPLPSAQKYQRLVNPLSLQGHRLSSEIKMSAEIIETCWPAALAICSTFLNAALDSEFYHVLIRSIQKLTQVSGVLELSTPRDALLTTLAKASLPNNASSLIAGSQATRTTRPDSADGLKSPTEAPQTPSMRSSSPPLNVRHLLCLRALLNLGIALGPTLDKNAWFILIETLQIVDALIAMPTTMMATSKPGSPQVGGAEGDGQSTLTTEIAAVQAATKRMLESTRSFSDASFESLVLALLRLLGQNETATQTSATPVSPVQLGTPTRGHRPSRSVSGLWTKSKSLDLEIGFVLSKLSDVSRINIARFASPSEQDCSWELIGQRLLTLCQDRTLSDEHRIQAASILDLISMETIKILDTSRYEAEEVDSIRARCLLSLLQQLESFTSTTTARRDTVEIEMHKRLLDALESMLSHSGESLTNCWPTALKILSVTFEKRGQGQPQLENATIEQADHDAQTSQLLRVAFRSLQLIVSDFLGVLQSTSLAELSHLLCRFGAQQYDLNIALTSTTMLWNVASHVVSNIDSIDISEMRSLETDVEMKLHNKHFNEGGLWSIILLDLTRLCIDEREDVRNAATRVQLKLLEASSGKLSASTWAASLQAVPFSAIRTCISRSQTSSNESSGWFTTISQLTEGVVQLVCANIASIASHEAFDKTWRNALNVLEQITELNTLSSSALAFTSLSSLLFALTELSARITDLVTCALTLWEHHSPAEIIQSQKNSPAPDMYPNQVAVASHAHALVVAYKVNNDAVETYFNGRADFLLQYIENALLNASHPAYTSDVKTLAPEQKELLGCLATPILHKDVLRYSRFLLGILRSTLNFQEGKIVVEQKHSAISKSVQRPTFIALGSACLAHLRETIVGYDKQQSLPGLLDVQDACQVLSGVIDTKYTKIPINAKAPLWRDATITSVVMLEALERDVTNIKVSYHSLDVFVTAPKMVALATSVFGHGGLSNPPGPEHKPEAILEDEIFDVHQFRLLHRALTSILGQTTYPANHACREYSVVLFRASLLAKPWFYDIPKDLLQEPLKDLLTVRRGSVHRPIFPVRRQICNAALDALFNLVRRPSPKQEKTADHNADNSLALAAAPYLILRVVHPIKTFLADQRLRGLTPPPLAQQIELQTILTKFVELRSVGPAMTAVRHSYIAQNQDSASSPSAPAPSMTTTLSDDDGKSHLRILYRLMLRLRTFWDRLPRLEGRGLTAWQDEEAGRGIVAALEMWQTAVAEGWGVE